MLKNIVAIIFALMFATACNKTASQGALGSNSAANMNASGENMGPGSEADLLSNVGDRVYFAFDSSSLDSDAQATLNRQANWLKNNPSVNVIVEGHCDELGTREYNLALGQRRANSVKDYLVSAGVDATRLSPISKGKEFPLILGTGEEVRRLNRVGLMAVN